MANFIIIALLLLIAGFLGLAIYFLYSIIRRMDDYNDRARSVTTAANPEEAAGDDKKKKDRKPRIKRVWSGAAGEDTVPE